MPTDTRIRWTTHSWNPVHGCSRVSEGCRHCYAERLSRRLGLTPKPWTAANAAVNVLLKPHKLMEPLRYKPGDRCFVNSMSDLFHDEIPDAYIDQVFATMALRPDVTFQILTKRPERMREYIPAVGDDYEAERVFQMAWELFPGDEALEQRTWPLPNVWLGVSVEDLRVMHRVTTLVATPAAVRFVSAEPLIGSLIPSYAAARGVLSETPVPPIRWIELDGIDWVIAGGESGPGFRPMEMAWAREIRDACVDQGVAFFFKQDAAYRNEQRPWLVEEDGSRFRWEQFPDDRCEPVLVEESETT